MSLIELSLEFFIDDLKNLLPTIDLLPRTMIYSGQYKLRYFLLTLLAKNAYSSLQ